MENGFIVEKRIKKSLLLFILFLFTMSCSSLPKEEGAYVYSKDGMIGVCVTKEGLSIKKKVSSKYKEIDIHVENITDPKKTDDSLFILEAKTSINEYVYPFVKKGQKYKVYLVLYTSPTSSAVYSKTVEVVAAGGLGESSLISKVSEKSYKAVDWTVTFDELNIKIPAKVEALPVTGYVVICALCDR